MVEIYKENLIDLLTDQPNIVGDHLIDGYANRNTKELKIKETPRETQVQGLTIAQNLRNEH